MKLTLKASIPLAVAFLIVVTCSDGPTGSPPNRPEIDSLDFVDTPAADYEAETAAYFLAGTRLAPKYWYDKIRTELQLIRSRHDSVPGVGVQYFPYADPSYLFLGFDPAETSAIRSGEYYAWDSLNAACQLDTFEFWRNYVEMHFAGVQNPIALLDLYKDLPGLWYASTSARFGDSPILVMRREGLKIKYFFREAWGDCPAGCIYSWFSYFTVSGGVAVYHGSFQNWSSDGTELPPPPAWADTAWQALRDYHQFASWTRGGD